MADWLEDLLADERWLLIKEMHDMGLEHPDYQEQLTVVRMCEKVLSYVRGSKQEAGW